MPNAIDGQLAGNGVYLQGQLAERDRIALELKAECIEHKVAWGCAMFPSPYATTVSRTAVQAPFPSKDEVLLF